MVATKRQEEQLMRVSALPPFLPEAELLTKAKVHAFSVRGRRLTEGDHRLDASFYADEAAAAERAVEDSDYPIASLGSLSQSIFHPPRFKRDWRDAKHGTPFLGGMEVLYLRPPKEKWLSPKQVEGLSLAVKHGWVLVTCSGTVGRTVFVTRSLDGWAVSQHVIRIVPAHQACGGYVFAYLTTWMGQALMLRSVYGGSIPEIEPDHLATIPVPLLPDGEQQEIHDQITKACRLRDEANDLLDQADELLHTELGLPRFDELQASYLGGVKKPRAFVVRASELGDRLDASFHIPIAKTTVQQLRSGAHPVVQLGGLAQRIFMPPTYKRVYVRPEHGLPILSGSHLVQQRPIDLKFISPTAFDRTRVENYRIRAGWILVTGRGTIGLPCLVPLKWDGWLASHNILRVIANARVHGGYIFAFLASSYGSLQMTAKQLGAVVNVLTPQDLSTIFLPNPPPEVQESIGTPVVQAFAKKEEANQIEWQAIRTLEEAITKSR
jgi:type I restriction enzyme S subunit